MNNIFSGVLVLLACTCFYFIKSEKKEYTTISWVVFSLLFLVAFYPFITKVIYRFSNPEIWDFTCFYLYGKVAAGGHDFYVAENFQHVFSTLHLPFTNYGEFIPEVVNVGFPYPPPTILYFAPLGFLSYGTALTIWTIFSLLCLFACIYLVYDLFFKKYKLSGLLLTLILFFISSEVRSTIFYSQTNFILLLLLLLMKKYANTKYAGIFLAIAMFTKPYMVVFVMFFILIKNWKAIAYFILSAFSLVGLTVALFGLKPFYSYIYDNPAHRLPASVFLEEMNQSLHSVLLRAKIITLEKPTIYLCIAAVLLLSSLAYLVYLQRKKYYDYIWAILLLIALILYPGTLTYYGVVLLFIIFHFFNEKGQLGFNRYLTTLIITIFFILSSISLFSCILFLLILIVLKSFNFFDRLSFLKTSA